MIFIDWNDVEISRRLNDGDVITAVTSDADDADHTECTKQWMKERR